MRAFESGTQQPKIGRSSFAKSGRTCCQDDRSTANRLALIASAFRVPAPKFHLIEVSRDERQKLQKR